MENPPQYLDSPPNSPSPPSHHELGRLTVWSDLLCPRDLRSSAEQFPKYKNYISLCQTDRSVQILTESIVSAGFSAAGEPKTELTVAWKIKRATKG